MNKDVIYIDVDDDITAIIGKVKASSESIVALVPPKRIGVLQSVVNLRILNHAAKTAKKRLVLISNDSALSALAASLKIPVAKNLQSKPEVPTVPALKVDDGDDIIDGADLPVGEHVAAAKGNKDDAIALDEINLDDDEAIAATTPYAKPPKKGALPAKPGKKPKVPNFNTFRKRFLLIGAGLVVLIGLLLWAIFIAPHATVVIAAKTHNEQLNSSVQLVTNQPTSASKGLLHATVVSDKKDVSIDFTATGSKDVGEKAKGSVTFSTDSISNVGKTVPAGTELTSTSGKTYITTQSATFSLTNSDGVTVAMEASDIGDDFNGVTGSLSGAPSKVSATVATSPTGGSKKTIKIVTQEDVQQAAEQLVSQDTDGEKASLKKQFSKNISVVDGSFTTSGTEAQSTPKVGEEAPDGKATLKSTITYSMTGVDYTDIKTFITDATMAKLPKENAQRVFDANEKKAQLSDFKAGDNGNSTATISATSQVGPDIDTDAIKKRVKGKQFGDIQSDLESINGVKDVQVTFFPFWLKTVPNDNDRITVTFNVQDNGN